MTDYDALLSPTPEWIEAAHQTEPCPSRRWLLDRPGTYLCDACGKTADAEVLRYGVHFDHDRPVSPPSFTVTEEPSKGDKVGIIALNYQANVCQTKPQSARDYEAITAMLDAAARRLGAKQAVVGRSEITAVEKVSQPPRASLMGKLWRVLLAPVVWLNEPETTIECPGYPADGPHGGQPCRDRYGHHARCLGRGYLPIPADITPGEFRKVNA